AGDVLHAAEVAAEEADLVAEFRERGDVQPPRQAVGRVGGRALQHCLHLVLREDLLALPGTGVAHELAELGPLASGEVRARRKLWLALCHSAPEAHAQPNGGEDAALQVRRHGLALRLELASQELAKNLERCRSILE